MLVLLLCLPGAAAALMTDPAGDTRLVAAVHDQPWPAPEADLLGLDVVEGADEVVLMVALAAPQACTCPGRDLHIDMERGHRRYVAIATERQRPWEASLWAREMYYDRFLAEVPVVAGEHLSIHLPRNLLLDDAGTAPVQGALLEGLHVHARMPPGPVRAYVEDTMGNATFRFLHGGGEGSSDLWLSSPAPMRASNGGQARFRFEVHVHSAATSVRLDAEGVPPDWQVDLPASVDVEGGQAAFEVFVQTPSRHQHGTTVSFRLVASSATASAWMALGIHYPEVAQPSGHHPRLWVHGAPYPAEGQVFTAAFAGQAGQLWLNTLEDDPQDAQVFVTGQANGQVTRWMACLQPDLAVGLTLDPQAQGSIAVQLRSDVPMRDVTLAGQVLHFGPGPAAGCHPDAEHGRNTTVLLELAPVRVAAVGTEAESLETELVATGLERVPFVPGASLALLLEADHGTPARTPLTLALGQASLHLPLLDHHEFEPASAAETVDGPAPARDAQSPVPPWLPAALVLVGWKRRRSLSPMEGPCVS